MDNLSHFITGVVVADALPFTKRLGPKAPLIAAIASAAPDADMIPAFFANFPPKRLSFDGLFDMNTVHLIHRAYTHSFFYMTLAAIPLAYLAWRWSGRNGKWLHWFLMLAPAFYLHTILDLTNPWGVRAWLPFSNSRSAFNVLPLIEPFILGAAAAVFLVNHVFRDSYPENPDNPAPLRQPWRQRTADWLNARIGATTVGVIGMVLIFGKIAWALITAPTLEHWF